MYMFVVNGNHLKLHNEHKGRAFQEAHNLHLGSLELNIYARVYAPPSKTEMTISVTHNVIIGRESHFPSPSNAQNYLWSWNLEVPVVNRATHHVQHIKLKASLIGQIREFVYV
jgi:hypothetical protein